MEATWSKTREVFLRTEREWDKTRLVARGVTVKVLNALEEDQCDLSVVSSVMSGPYGTTFYFTVLNPNEEPAELNKKVEAQRQIVVSITRCLGIEGKKNKAMYDESLRVDWESGDTDPPTGAYGSAIWDPWDRKDPRCAEYIKRQQHRNATSVHVQSYVPPTCRFVTKTRSVAARAAGTESYTVIECGPEKDETA